MAPRQHPYASLSHEALTAGRAGEQEYLQRLRAFNPMEGLQTMAEGAWGSISERLKEQMQSLRGEQAGMGRTRGGFGKIDEDNLYRSGMMDLSHIIQQGALQAQGQQLGAIGEWGGYASGRMGQGLNLVAAQREEQLARDLAKQENRANMWGSLLSAGGTIASAAILASDENLKEDVRPIDTVRSLKGVEWAWNDKGREKGLEGRSAGVIAQDVEQTRPDLVHRDTDGTRAVDYGGLVGVLVETSKELDQRMRQLEAKLAKRRVA